MISFEVGVILPSAGTGERVGASSPKQYIEIMGRPILLYALEEVLRPPWVRRVALVVDSPEKVQTVLDGSGIKGADRVSVVRGGCSRHRSIRNGLQALQKAEAGVRVVVVHDAVRPLVPAELLERLVVLAEHHGAAGATRPLTSTVVRASPDAGGTLLLQASLDRDSHLASETPQAFRTEVLATAYNKSTEDELDRGTECLALVLRHAGVRPRLLEGPPDLWKVTHKRDVYAAAGCLRERSTRVCVVAAADTEAARLLAEELTPRVGELARITTGSLPEPGDSPPGTPPATAAAAPAVTSTYNTVVFFHVHEISQDGQLLDLATVLDVEKQGVIVHVIEHPEGDGMRGVSALELHRSGRHMARHHEKLRKAVVVVHWLSAGEERGLAHLVSALVLSDDPRAFSGQTLFL
ncbi:D-ribitol-5-phosphate cytidylyltransferase-like [Schistocerca serialis cubense]|uniref:D-ribitol-5-phosphate cytidylyltransferase-like n=1 Tax=Schistocerca serialis cubense TaxID=2023355 RepID=UPI00214E4C6C|nr:D-ribitol-5-phosphate cytidylyltransferase-like [Schistocerca serialis cubense]